MRERVAHHALEGMCRNGHRDIEGFVFDEQHVPVKTFLRCESDGMDDDVSLRSRCGILPFMKEFGGGILSTNVDWIEGLNGTQFIFQLENAAHEALLISKNEFASGLCQAIADRPSD